MHTLGNITKHMKKSIIYKLLKSSWCYETFEFIIHYLANVTVNFSTHNLVKFWIYSENWTHYIKPFWDSLI